MDTPWPADHVERRDLESLVPYARNARTHSDAQVAQLAASIAEWGWTIPVLVDEAGQIIAGHGRVLAARKLGLAAVPVMVAAGWSDAKRRAYVLADNKLALNAGWDEDLLRGEIADLQEAGIELSLTGFTSTEISGLLIEDAGALDFGAGLGDSGFSRVRLSWGDKRVPLSEAELALLNALLAEVGAEAFPGVLVSRIDV